MFEQILMDELFVKAIASLLVAILALTFRYLSASVKSKMAKNAIDILAITLDKTVKGIEQTVVQDIKAAKEDGKLTEQEKLQIKQAAITSVKSQLGDGTKKLLSTVFDDLDEVLDKWLESAVGENKKNIQTDKVELKMISKE